MKTHFQILIIGGGNAGISAASQLLIKNKQLDIAILDPNEFHYYQPAWTLVGGGEFDIASTKRPQSKFIPRGAQWLKEKVSEIDADNNTITCKSGQTYTYDYLIVAPGIQLDWYKIKGLEETLGKNGVTSNYLFDLAPQTWKFAEKLTAGKALFTNPNTPIKCGGAPQKIMYLLSDKWKRKGVLKDIDVHFYSGGGIIFGVKKYADTLNKVIERYGIQTHFKHNLIAVDGPKQVATFEKIDAVGNIEVITETFDLLHVTPPQSAPDFIKKSSLSIQDNAFGWVEVDKYILQHVRYPNVFSCGDVCSTPNAKTGAAIRKQVPVLVANLLSLMAGKELVAKYNGYGSCPLITGKNKLVFAEFDYDNNPTETFPINQAKERFSMYLLKKFVLPWFYWHRILQGRA